MRLIDADEIKEHFNKNTWQGEMMIAICDNIQTAYNVDNVVKQLEEKAKENLENDKWSIHENLKDAIIIVKNGGDIKSFNSDLN